MDDDLEGNPLAGVPAADIQVNLNAPPAGPFFLDANRRDPNLCWHIRSLILQRADSIRPSPAGTAEIVSCFTVSPSIACCSGVRLDSITKAAIN